LHQENAMRAFTRYGLVGLMVLAPVLARAACPDDAAVASFVADFKAARVSKGISNDVSKEDAQCYQRKVVKALEGEILGNRIGYKAAFSHPDVMKRMKVTEPSWAVMLNKYMLKSGDTVPTGWGAHPGYEPEMVAVVKDAGLADANTPLEALQHLTFMVPYIELVDTIVSGANANGLIATNIAFRGGVLGTRVKAEATQKYVDMLANMTVAENIVLKDGQKKELGAAHGDALMGHPLNVVMWMAKNLKKDGVTLKPGDLLDLGGYLVPGPMQPGSTVNVKYNGFPGEPTLTVHFQ
jgi:2-oxo-hept-3-ene-1,7-dioate hydratase